MFLLQDIKFFHIRVLIVCVTASSEKMTLTARVILDLVVKPSACCRAFDFICFLFHQMLEVHNFLTLQAYSGKRAY